MNHTYRVVFNETTGTYVAVAEIMPAKGKKSKSSKTAIAAAVAALAGISGEAGAVAVITTGQTGLAIGTANTGAGRATATDGSAIAIGSGASSQGQREVVIGERAQGTNSGFQGAGHIWYGNPHATISHGVAAATGGNDVAFECGTTNALVSSVVSIGSRSIARGGGVAIGDSAFVDGAARSLGVAVGANARSTNGGVVIGSSAETIGTNAVAIGRQAVAKGEASQAYGVVAAAVGNGSLAMGQSATSRGDRSIAIGMSQSAEQYNSTTNVQANGTDSIAIGSVARSESTNSIAIGKEAKARNYALSLNATETSPRNTQSANSIAMGTQATSWGNNTIAIGHNAQTVLNENVQAGQWTGGIGTNHVFYGSPYSSMGKSKQDANSANEVVSAIDGNYSTRVLSASIAIGHDSSSSGGGVALGSRATVTRNTSGESRTLGVAIGANALSRGGGVVVGSSAETRGINAVAVGRQAVAQGSASQAYGVVAAAVGNGSLAMGQSATSLGERSIAIGMSESAEQYDKVTNVYANGTDSIAMGSVARANAINTIAMGRNAIANTTDSIAIGAQSRAGKKSTASDFGGEAGKGIAGFKRTLDLLSNHRGLELNKTAMAQSLKALEAYDVLGGKTSTQFVDELIAIAGQHTAWVDARNAMLARLDQLPLSDMSHSIAMGSEASSLTHNSIAIGRNAQNQGKRDVGNNMAGPMSEGQIAIGWNANTNSSNVGVLESSGAHAIAIGTNTSTIQSYDIAIGGESKIQNNAFAGTRLKSSNVSIEHMPSVALGFNATSHGIHGDTILGSYASNTMNDKFGIAQSTAVGSRARVYGDQSMAFGADTTAMGNASIAIGGDDIDKATEVLKASVDVLKNRDLKKLKTIGSQLSKLHGNDANSTKLVANLLFGEKVNTLPESAQYIRTTAGGDASIAMGATTQSLGVGSVALGVNAITYGNASIAQGVLAHAGGENSIAAGSVATTSADDAIAIGHGAKAGGNVTGTNVTAPDNKGQYAIAIGRDALASGNESISVGHGNQVTGDSSGAFGDPSLISGSGSYSIGNNNTITTNDTFVLGSSVNRKNDDVGNVNASYNGTVANSVYLGKDSEATAGAAVGTAALTSEQVASVDANATTDAGGNVTKPATKKTTTAGDKGTVANATVGGYLYGGFAGATANGVVTIGASGSERRLQNVAAGEISATSTDAINGSQLYAAMNATARGWDVLNGTNAVKGTVTPGDKVKFVAGKGIEVDVADEANNVTTITISSNIQPGTSISNTNLAVNDNGSLVSPPANGDSYVNATSLVEAINKTGWNVTSGKVDNGKQDGDASIQQINPGDEVKFQAGNGLTIKQEGSNFTYSVATGNITTAGNKAVGNTTAGNIATVGDVENVVNNVAWTLQENAEKKDDVKAGDIVNFANGTGTSVSIETSNNNVSTVKVNVVTAPVTFNTTTDTASTTNSDAPVSAGDVVNVTNALVAEGMNFVGNDGTSVIHKNLGQTLNITGGMKSGDGASDKNTYVDVQNGKLVVKISETPTFNNVTLGNGTSTVTLNPTSTGLTLGNATGAPVQINNVAPGTNGTDAVNLDQLNGTKWSLNTYANGGVAEGSKLTQVGNSTVNLIAGKGIKTTQEGANITFEADVNTTVANTKLDINDNGSVKTPDTTAGSTFVNATSLAEAINKTGWNVTSGKVDNGKQDGNASIQQINPGDEVKFQAGNGLTIKQEGSNFTYSVATGNITTAGNKAVGNTTAGNIATVGDVENVVNNVAWTLQENAEKKDDVKAGDIVNFANGTGTSVSIETSNNNVSTVKVNVVTAPVTFNTTTDTASTTNSDAPVSAGDVVNVTNALVAEGMNFVGNDGTSVIHKNLGQTLNITGGMKSGDGASDKNTYVDVQNGKLVVKISETPTFNNVTLGNGTSTVTLNPTSTGLTLGNATGAPVQINNVAPGTNGTDAVNLDQLNGTKWSLNTYANGGVAEGSKLTQVGNSTVNLIAGKGIKTTQEGANITFEADVNTTVANTKLDINDNGSVKTPDTTAGSTFVNATSLAEAINKTGWNVTSGKVDNGKQDGNASIQQINPGDEVKFQAGNGLTIKQEGSNFTYSVATGNITTAGNKAVGNTTAGNIATVGDVENVVNNVAWTLQENAEKKDDVKAGDIVNFANGTGTSVSIETSNNNVSTVKVNVVTAPVTFNTTTDTASTTNSDAPVSAGDVVNVTNALVAEGMNFVGNDGTSVIHKNLGQTLNITGGMKSGDGASDKNTYVDVQNGKLVVKISETPTFNNVTLGNGTSTVTLNPTSTGLTLGNATGAPVQINNVAPGTNGTDAVNLDQLNGTKWSLNTYANGGVAEGSKLTQVGNSTVNLIAGKGIKTTQEGANITFEADVNTTVANTKLDINDNGSVKTPDTTAGSTFVNATSLAEAINKTGWNVTSGKVDNGKQDGNASIQQINPGDEVKFQAGNGLTIKQEGSNFTYSVATGNITTADNKAALGGNTTAGNIATVGDVVGAINNSGFTLTSNGAENGTLVNPGDTLNFANGQGTVVNITTAENGTSTIKFDTPMTYVDANGTTNNATNTVKLVGAEPVQLQNVASGVRTESKVPAANATTELTPEDKKAIAEAINNANGSTLTNTANIGDLQAASAAAKTEVVEGKNMNVTSETGANGQTIYTVETEDNVTFNHVTVGGDNATNTAPITIGTVTNNGTSSNVISNLSGNLPNTYNQDAYNPNNVSNTLNQSLPSNLNLTHAATVGDILNAGWNIQENSEARDFVKAYDTVNFVNGTGTVANVSVSKDGTVANVTYNVKVDGKTVKFDENGNLTAAGGTIVKGGTGASVSSTTDTNGVTTYTVTATGVAKPTTNLDNYGNGTVGVPDTGNATDLVNAGDIVTAINNSGFTLTSNGAENGTLVNPGDTLNFANGQGTVVNITTAENGTSTIKFDTPMTYVDANGTTNNATNTVKLVGAEPVQLQNVASGVRTESKVPAANATTELTPEDKKAIAEAINNANGSTLTNTANIGDLQAASAAAKTEVVEGKNMNVTSETGANGQTIYTVETEDNVTFNHVTVGGDNATNTAPITIGTVTNNGNSSNVISNLSGNLPNTYNQDAYNPNNVSNTLNQSLPSNLNLTHAATVGDILNAGWNIQENSEARDFVKAYDTVNFVNGTGTVANVSVSKDGTVANVTYNVKVDGKTVKFDENGNLTAAGGTIVKGGTGASVSSTTDTNGVTTYTVTATGVAKPTTNLDNYGNGTVGVPDTGNATDLVNAGDIVTAINNSGFTLTSNGAENGTLVNPGDTLNFANGQGTVVNITTAENGTSTIKFDTPMTYVDANGTTNNATNTVKLVGAEPVQLQNVASGVRTESKVPAANATTELTPEDKKAIAEAINNANGSTLTNTANIGDLQAASAAAKTEVVEGKNMNVTSETGANGQTIYTVETEDNVTFNHVTVGGDNATNTAPITIGTVTNNGTSSNVISNLSGNLPNTYNQDAYNPNNVSNTLNQSLPSNLNLTHAATVGDILNAGWNIQENSEARDFVKAYDTVNFVNGTGTVANVSVSKDGTVANVTYNVKVDGKTVKFDENGNLTAAGGTIVKGGTGASVSSTTDTNGVTTYTVTATGVAKPTTNLDNYGNGTVGVPDTGNATDLVNAGDIVTAINNSGFTLTSNGAENGTLVNPGDTLNFANGQGTVVNITTAENGTSTIKFDTPMTYVDANGTTNNATNTVKLVGAEPVQLQNVASGVRTESKVPAANATTELTPEDKKAIAEAINNANGSTLTNTANIGDLQAASAAAKTEVVEGKNMNVTSETGANGQTIYTVETEDNVTFNHVTVGGDNATNTAPITIGTVTNNGNSSNVISNLSGNLPNTYNQDAYNPNNVSNTLNQSLPSNLNLTHAATVGDILNAGWNIQENSEARDFVKAYDTVNFVNGTGTVANVSVSKDGTVANVTYNVKVDGKTVKFDENGNLTAAGGTIVKGGTGASVSSTTDTNGVTTYTVTATGVAKPTTNLDNYGNGTVGVPDTGNATDLVNAGDIVTAINNSGFTLTSNGAENGTLVNPGDTLNFANGQGTVVNITTAENGTSTIKFDTPMTYVDANGTTNNATNTVKLVGAEPVQLQNVASGVRTESKVPAANATTELTPEDKKAIAEAINNANGSTLTNTANIGDLQAASAAAKTEVVEGKNMNVTSETGANGQTIYTVETEDNVTFNHVTVGGDNATNTAPITIGTVTNNGNSSNVISNLSGNLPNTYNQDAYNPNNVSNTLNQSLPSNLNLTHAATVGDILNAGWNIQENSEARDFVKAYDTVNFVNGTGTVANVSVSKDGTVANVTYNVKVDGKTVKFDENGNLTAAGGTIVKGGTGASVSSTTDTNGVTTYTVTATGVAKPTTNLDNYGNGTVGVPDTGNATDLVNAGDIVTAINNSGFTLTSNGAENGTLVNPGDTLNFANGQGTVVNITTAENGTSTIKFDTPMTYVDANGTTNNATNTVKLVGAEPVQLQNVASGVRTESKVPAANATTELTPEDKKAIAEAINNANGSTLTNTANIGDLQAASAAAKTEVVEGKNMNVTSETGANGQTIYTVETEDNVTFNHVTVGGDNATNTAPITIGTVTNNGNSSNVISNLSGNLPNTYNQDAYNPNNVSNTLNQSLPSNLNLTHAATVGDILNAGWNIQENSEARDFVKAYDTVNFVNGTGTVANVSVSKDGTVANVTYNVKVDGKTVKFDENGNLTAAGGTIVKGGTGASVSSTTDTNGVTTYTVTATGVAKPTTNLDNYGNGTVGVPDTGNATDLVNAGDIVTAINNSGFTLTSNGAENGTLVNPGDTLNFANGQGTVVNITTAENGTSTIKFDTPMTYVDANGTTNNATNTVKLVGAEPVQLQNVASGVRTESKVPAANATTELTPEDKKAIAEAINNANGSTLTNTANIGDLQAASAAAKTEVVEGKNMNVTSETGANGQTIYTVETEDNVTFNHVTVGGDNATNTAPITIGTVTNNGTSSNVISNLSGNLPNTYNQDAYNPNNVSNTLNQSLPSNLNLTHAATVGDILNAGWNIQENSAARDFVKAYDTVNFVNGTGTVANVSVNDDGTIANVTYNVKVDNKTVKIDNSTGNLVAVSPVVTSGTGASVATSTDDNGATVYTVSATGVSKPTTNLEHNTNGTVSLPNPNNATDLVNADQIVNAINNSGFTLTSNGAENGTLVNPGDTLNFANGQGTVVNITTAENGTSTIKFDTPMTYVDPSNTSVPTSDATNTVKLVGAEPVKIVNVDSGLLTYVNTMPNNVTSNMPKANLVDLNTPNISNNTAATVGDLRNMGWIVSADKTTTNATLPYSDSVKNAQEVKFVGTNMANVTGATDGDVRTITVDVHAQSVTNAAQLPVVYTNQEGKKVYLQPDGNFTLNANGSGSVVPKANVIASMNSGDNLTNNPTTLANVKGNLADASNAANVANNFTTPANNTVANLGNVTNNAATVGDVLNAGWNLQENGKAKDVVTHADTVNFVNGQGTVVNIATAENGTSTIKFDTPMTYVVEGTNNATNVPTNSVNLVGGDANLSVTLGNLKGADVYTNQTAPRSDAIGLTNLTAAPITNAATIGDLRNMGWVVGTPDNNFSNPVKNANRVDFVGINGAHVSGSYNNTTGVNTVVIDVQAQGVTNAAQLPVVYTNQEGKKVYLQSDGNFTLNANGSGSVVPKANVIASMNSGDNLTNNPTTLANVKGNLADASNAANVANNFTTPANNMVANLGNVTNNAATVGDVLNAGWNLQENGKAKDVVTHADTVNFVNGQGTVVNIATAENGTSTIKFDTPLSYTDSTSVKNNGNQITQPSNAVTFVGVDNKPVSVKNVASGVGENLTGTAFVTNLTAATGDQLTNAVNVGDLQNLYDNINTSTNIAIANTGFGLNGSKVANSTGVVTQAPGLTDADKRIGLNETMNLNAGNNINITQTANGFDVATNMNMTVDSVTISGGTSPTNTVSLSNTGLNNGGNTITNVAPGVNATDAVNVSQLKDYGVNIGSSNSTALPILTYDSNGNTEQVNLDLRAAIANTNEQGTKYFHFNDGRKPITSNSTQKNDYDSTATAINTMAIGPNAEAGVELFDKDGNKVWGDVTVIKTELNAAGIVEITKETTRGVLTAGEGSMAQGMRAKAIAEESIAVGVDAVAGRTIDANLTTTGITGIEGKGAVAIGNKATASENGAVAVGRDATVTQAGGVAVGEGSAATRAGLGENVSVLGTNVDNRMIAANGGVIPSNVVYVMDQATTPDKAAVAATATNSAAAFSVGSTKAVYKDANGVAYTYDAAAQVYRKPDGTLTTVKEEGAVPLNVAADATVIEVNRQITNVAAGSADSDAVNVSQLKAVANGAQNQINNLNAKIDNVADNADAGTAAAMATAGLPQVYLPGKSMVAVAGSTYRGKQGYAVGFSAITDGGNWIIKGSVSGHSKGKFGATVGAGYQW